MIEAPLKLYECRNLVAGAWRLSRAGEILELRSPHTGAKIGSVPMSGAEDVADIAAASEIAAASWRTVPLKERSQLLFRFRELVLRDVDKLGQWAALEAGKTVPEAVAGVLKGIEVIEYALSLQNLDDGGALDVSRGVSCEVRREPMGVVAGITPFNFPAMVPMWLFPAAVTLGNAFVLKPSEKVPITSCILGELMIEAGYPPGVFSILHGGAEAARALIDHPGISALGFVGSTAAARNVYERAAGHGKRALCLGGAKESPSPRPRCRSGRRRRRRGELVYRLRRAAVHGGQPARRGR